MRQLQYSYVFRGALRSLACFESRYGYAIRQEILWNLARINSAGFGKMGSYN